MCAVEYYTYDQYATWEGDWELIGGVAYAMAPAPMISHQAVAGEIIFALMLDAGGCPECLVLGEADWKISDDTVVRPDVVLTCRESHPAHMTKAPEIVFEIVSPSSAERDEQYKFSLYESEQVQYYVLIYTETCRARIFRWQAGKLIEVADVSNDTFRFETRECDVSVNFDRVFRKFRR